MANEESQRRVFDFLRSHLEAETAFTKDELAEVGNWKGQTPDTYLSKHLKDYLRPLPDGCFRVKRIFRRFGRFEDFKPLVTQVKKSVARYTRSSYSAVVSYEFLLPLTREGELRSALDELFYHDTVDDLVRDLEDEGRLAAIAPSKLGESVEERIQRTVGMVAEMFGGYSISHVNGRFRADGLATRKDAAEKLVRHEPYLVDETTAVVRFIFPCRVSETRHGDHFDFQRTTTRTSEDVDEECGLIRRVFFAVFVEAIAKTVKGEDVVWLVETSPQGERLYALEKDD